MKTDGILEVNQLKTSSWIITSALFGPPSDLMVGMHRNFPQIATLYCGGLNDESALHNNSCLAVQQVMRNYGYILREMGGQIKT